MIEQLLKFENVTQVVVFILDILKSDNMPINTVGDTQRTLLAREVRSCERIEIINIFTIAILRIASCFSELSKSQLQNLCDLIQLVEVDPKVFAPKYLEEYLRWPKSEKNVEERAIILRLLGEAGAIKPALLKSSEDIKKEMPWFWIDAAAVVNWEGMVKEVSVLLNKNKDIRPLLLRLHSWWQDVGVEKELLYSAVSRWLPLLDGDAREELKISLDAMGVVDDEKWFDINKVAIIRSAMPDTNNLHFYYPSETTLAC